MISPDLQRISAKVRAQPWRWLALPAGLFLVATLYLSFRPGASYEAPKLAYPELLAATTTLAGNERRYQHTLEERQKLIEKEGGSQIDVFPPPHGRYYVLWDFFIPGFSCPHPTYRIGLLADGGKWVCGFGRVLQSRPNCIVYSLNSATPSYSSFELGILQKSSACEIYAFDDNTAPSKWPWGETDVGDTDFLAARIHFNEFAISNPTAKKNRSLRDVMRGFSHDWIDILKMDLHGSEFATLLAIIAENGDEPLPFGQLLLTVNVPHADDMTTVAHFQDWFTRLECAGLRPFYFEVSMMDVNNRRGEPGVVYWSFMNIRGTHALVDDSWPELP
ncbi:Methyltranfer-dom domain-containing protein [Mycena sanguinolenta]|uniref:Methyltranfer-dom domain-containing protein n=1 Tax=Mycena sanguinolenta TaxID=230812 RepID=A0A8H6YSC4_9AGAR|nr:Methyltranfer-dom domain-containing protein [Mycena sanguinolenta]